MAIKWSDDPANGFYLGDDGEHDDAFVIDATIVGHPVLLTSGVGHTTHADVAAAKIAAESEFDATHVLESGVHRCPCCGDDTHCNTVLCTDCKEAGCASSMSGDGDMGFWDCQQDSTVWIVDV